MRLLLAALLICHPAFGFVPIGVGHRFGSTSLYISEEKKSTLTSKDILARARKAAGMPVEEDIPEAPKLFEDGLLDDMQKSLLKLERRVKEGPGSLSLLEVEEFEAATQRILAEMKQKVTEDIPASRPAPVAAAAASPAPVAPVTEPAPAAGQVRKSEEVIDTSNDEGPGYDGKGGMGLAKGTANTYIIPGMDEMTPEEYRKALQKSVSDRQTRRKDSREGVVGNRAALQYLDQLGYGGASNNWKKKDDPKDEAEPK